MPKTAYGILLFLFLSPVLLCAQNAAAKPDPASCRKFVQGFYNWYLPTIQKEHELMPPSRALKAKSRSFDPELLKRLDEDFEAASKNSDEIVGLDFDPFLDTQEPGERYVAGKASVNGNRCSVEIYRMVSGKKSDRPDVVPQLVLKNGSWIFVNFRYQGDEDLLSVLARLKADRQKSSK